MNIENDSIQEVVNIKPEQEIKKNVEDQINFINFKIEDFDFFYSQKNISLLQELQADNSIINQDINQYFRKIYIYKLNNLVIENKDDIYSNLINIYTSMYHCQSTIFIIINCDGEKNDFYIGGLSDNKIMSEKNLKNNIFSNFPGTKITLENTTIQKTQEIFENLILRKDQSNISVCSVSIVPSIRSNEKSFNQGIEKFINSMSNAKYTMFILAKPIDYKFINNQSVKLEQLSTKLSAFEELILSYQNSLTDSKSYAIINQVARTIADSTTISSGNSYSYSVTEHSTTSLVLEGGDKNNSTSVVVAEGIATNSGETTFNGTSETHATGKTDTQGEQIGKSQGVCDMRGFQFKIINKSVQEARTRVLQQLERIKTGKNYGLWDTAAYIIADDISSVKRASSILRALMTGEDSQSSCVNFWQGENNDNLTCILESLCRGQHPQFFIQDPLKNNPIFISSSLPVNGRVLPLLFGLPRKSIPGISVDFQASFGREVCRRNYIKGKTIKLGHVCVKGLKQSNTVDLSIEQLCSHCLITGTTGSGKTNAAAHIIKEITTKSDVNFLIIEPVKGEWKHLFGGNKNINIFCSSPTCGYPLLHLNPFSFPEGIHLYEHMDMLVEVLSACWPMRAAMPAILKQAVELTYNSVGWDTQRSIHVRGIKRFPQFRDLLFVLPKVIKDMGYSAETRADYEGALISRIKSLMNGILGKIFISDEELSYQVLFDQNTIIDLSNIAAEESKSLIMGLIIMKLREYRNLEHCMNNNLRHITLLEEAHRLLRKAPIDNITDTATIAGKSVTMLSEAIAEMRTYGEGFFIVDQSPSSLNDVVIKNTATKIFMQLPTLQDCEIAATALALNDQQAREIARLPAHTAIVSQSGWREALMVQLEDANLRPISLPNVHWKDDGTIHKILEHPANRQRINTLLENSSMPEALKTEIIRACRRLWDKSTGFSKLKIATFHVEVTDCRGLADILPPRFQTEEEFLAWRNEIAILLDAYLKGPKNMKINLAESLLQYMAYVEKRPLWINALTILADLGVKL